MSSSALALARLESRRLLRNPIVYLGVVAGAVVMVLVTAGRAPVLQRDDMFIGLALLPLAGAALLVSNLASLRSHRDGTDELYESTITPVWVRTTSHLVSAASLVAVAIAFAAGVVVYLLASGGVGEPRLAEVMAGPATVALMAAVGVALARLCPSAAAGPIALVALVTVHLYLSTGIVDSTDPGPAMRWLAPWVAPSLSIGDPTSELLIRPSLWHLVYLLAMTSTCAALALAASRRNVLTVGIAAVLFVVSVAAGTAQLGDPPAEERAQALAFVADTDRVQVCEERGSVRYCAYRGYEPWIDEWAAAVGPVVELVPPDAVPAGMQVRQFPNAWGVDLPVPVQNRLTNRWAGGARDLAARYFPDTEIYAPAAWPAEGEEGPQELALALAAAGWAVGFPPTPRQLDFGDEERSLAVQLADEEAQKTVSRMVRTGSFDGCSAAGQGRALVALWLAGRASPGARAALRSAVPAAASDQNRGEPPQLVMTDRSVTGNPVWWGGIEAASALQLLERPEEEVARAFHLHWGRLVSPDTGTGEAARLLGLRPPEPAPVPDARFYSRRALVPCP